MDATDAPTATSTDAVTVSVSAPEATSTAAASSIGDFGSCSVPQIEFGVGFDNRKETSFEPVDKSTFSRIFCGQGNLTLFMPYSVASYDHGSAQNIDIITQFICDTLVNKCGADQTAKDTCASAKAAADTVTAKTGGQADAFNAVFGITTNFAAVASVDDQGNVIAGTGSSSGSAASAASTTAVRLFESHFSLFDLTDFLHRLQLQLLLSTRLPLRPQPLLLQLARRLPSVTSVNALFLKSSLALASTTARRPASSPSIRLLSTTARLRTSISSRNSSATPL